MRFFSDNAAAACPEALAAIAAANRLDTAYDGDSWSARLDGAFSELFETQVTALWVATGTAANALALAALCPPHGSIVCHRDAHIQNDECGAPEFYTHGAKLLLGEGEGAKLTPEAVPALLATVRNDVHQTQPAALSITNATEYGLVYTAERDRRARRARAAAARLGFPCRRRPLRQRRRQHRRVAGRPDLARRSRRAQLRLRQEWRDFGGSADLLRRPAPPGDALPAQARRPSPVEGALSGGPASRHDRGRRVAAQRARRERGGGPPRLGGGSGPAGASGQANEIFLR